jgi:LacI family transcriptional regulator
VDLNPRAIGDRAARLLLNLMAGRKPPKKSILIPPVGVVTRASSDFLAVADPYVSDVVRQARDGLADGIRIQDLARKMKISRRHLSNIFRERAHFTPVAMLRHLAVARAKQLLLETDLTIAQVADKCGHSALANFNSLFRTFTGVTPAAYRKTARPAGWRPPSAIRTLTT